MIVPRYKLLLEYDGSAFVGWQHQENGFSVQQALEDAILNFSGKKVRVFAAGRTDAGVHAAGQVIHFDLARAASAKTVRDALNDHLRRNEAGGPRRIAVLASEEVDERFHARISATRRVYRYCIVNRPAPLAFDRDRAWHVFAPLDAAAMDAAARNLVGKHDFTTFRSVHCQADSPVKTLDRLAVSRDAERVRIVAEARSFLHSQVRAMAGTLVRVGEGKWTPGGVAAALEARDRARSGPTAPAHGLTLIAVHYDER